MVAVNQSQRNTEKLDVILKAAQKRLGRYGFEKTTMSEIAADVNLSKASLYYYFPDKERLLHSVLSKEQDEYFGLIARRMDEVHDPEMMVFEFIRIRHEYFTTFLNLTKFRFSDFYQIRPYFRELISNLHSRETELFAEILQKGIIKGIFCIKSPKEKAWLFLEIIHGLRLIVIRNRPIQELKQEDYDLMFQKHQDFIHMFIRSIRKNQ
jgi:AcrR family transcriptional regulator